MIRHVKLRVLQVWSNDQLCPDLADFGHLLPDLWPNEIVGMAMAIVAIPDITSMPAQSVRLHFSFIICLI